MLFRSAADVDDAMWMSETRKEGLTGTLQSETFYYTGFGKGDEIADYAINYKTNGTSVRNASIYFYGSVMARASAADVDDAMWMSETRKEGLGGTLQP